MAVTKQPLGCRPPLTCEEQCRRPDDLLLHDNACLVLLAWLLISSAEAPLSAVQDMLHAARTLGSQAFAAEA